MPWVVSVAGGVTWSHDIAYCTSVGYRIESFDTSNCARSSSVGYRIESFDISSCNGSEVLDIVSNRSIH